MQAPVIRLQKKLTTVADCLILTNKIEKLGWERNVYTAKKVAPSRNIVLALNPPAVKNNTKI
jgi:hypothetical protein